MPADFFNGLLRSFAMHGRQLMARRCVAVVVNSPLVRWTVAGRALLPRSMADFGTRAPTPSLGGMRIDGVLARRAARSLNSPLKKSAGSRASENEQGEAR